MATIQGAYITVLGMAILFVALLILMLAAMGLERLFRPKQLVQGPASESEKALVAAVAVAIALKLQAQSPKRKSKIENRKSKIDLSAWKPWGRYRQLMRSRELKRHRR